MKNDWQERQRQEQQRQEKQRQDQQRHLEQQRQEQLRRERQQQEQQRQEQLRHQEQLRQEKLRLGTAAEGRKQAESDQKNFPNGWANQSGWSSAKKEIYDAERHLGQQYQQGKQSNKPFWKFW